MKRTAFLLAFLLICSSIQASGKLKQIGTQNGLSSKRTFSLKKDKKGFMWISTRLGIDRYDGSSIKQYALADITGSQDLTGRVNTLKKDKSGDIWAFTNFGQIFQYNELSDSYLLKLDLANKFADTSPLLNGMFFVDNDQIIVFGSFGIWIYNLESKTLLPIKEFKDVYVFTLEVLEKNTFAIASDKGLCVTSLDLKKHRVIEKTTSDIGINERVQCIYYEKLNSTLLLGTFSGKLFFYNLKDESLTNLGFNFKTSVRDIKSYNNTIYVATSGAGLIAIDKNGKQKTETYTTTILNSLNLSSYSFYNILFDNEQLWIATHSDGVYLLDENLPDFQTFSYQSSNEKDKSNSLNTFLEDSDGNLWFGTNDGVLRYEIKTKSWKHLMKYHISNNVIRYNALTLCEDNEGNIWVGGSTFGMASCINKKTLRVTDNQYFNIDPKGSVNGRIYSIFKDSDGNIWLGGLHGLLTKFDPVTKQIKRYNIKSVNTITECDKRILVGTIRGVYIQNKDKDSFTHLLTTKKLQTAMLSYINIIHEDKQGILWLGSEGGLLRYDRELNDVKIFTKADGLLSNSIFGILQDKRDRLWLSTEKGLVCFNPTENNFMYFGVEEGLDNERFSPRSQFRRKNGEFFFGNHSGIVSFRPEKIDLLKVNSHLVFTDFNINYLPIHPSDENDILENIIDKTTSLQLKYNQNTFSFGFRSINFTNPHRTRFEWQLEGYDKDWVRGIDVNNVYYTNVPSGQYKFHLRSIDSNDGKETERRTILIDISQPIWSTVWAKMFYLLIFLVLSWIISQFIKGRLEKRNASEKIHFFVHTAHELKTPVALIKGPLNKLKKDEELTQEGNLLLDLVIKNTDRLNNLISQLLDFQKTEMSEVKLYVSEKEVNSYLQEKLKPFHELVKEKNIDLKLNVNPEPLMVWIDEEKIGKVVNNLFFNALKYTPSNGKITVSVFRDEKNWSLEVRDNGIGVPEKFQKDIFQPFYRAENAINSTETGSGIGLLLTKNLVELHCGTISFDSEENVGTVFSLKFPLGIKHYKKNKAIFVDRKIEPIKVIQPDNDKKLSLLIVEDNDEFRYFLKQCLTDKYTIYEAINGHEGVKTARIVLPELIISDIMMPEMNGYELCKRIKESKETSHIPIILVTALDDNSNILKGYEFGADNYITKPFDSDILKLTIENTISTRQALRRNLILPLEKEINNEIELATNELDKKFLDEVMEIIDNNISNSEFAINDLCKQIAMSRTSFYNKIKILTNQSPNSFVRLVRLNRAAKILKKEHISISEVASRTGFGDVKYFSTAFKKHFGVSPKKYEN